MAADLTLVTAALDIGREALGGGFGRPFAFYRDRLEALIGLGLPTVVYADPRERLAVREEHCRLMPADRAGLERFAWFTDVQRIRREPEWRGRAPWLADSPQASLPHYNPLVMSKLLWLADQARANPFGTRHFVWIDGGIVNTVPLGLLRSAFSSPALLQRLGRFLVLCYPYRAVAEVHGFEHRAMARYANVASIEWVARGGFFGGAGAFVTEAARLYAAMLDETLRHGLMGTEESVFTILAHLHPGIFDRFSIGPDGLVAPFFAAVAAERTGALESADRKLDAALHRLGPLGREAVVLSVGSDRGVAAGTRGYVQRYGWTELRVDAGPAGDGLAPALAAAGVERIDVLHVDTGTDDWDALRQFDFERHRPKVVRLRRNALRGAAPFLASRHLGRHGYDVMPFYDELVALRRPDDGAATPASETSVRPAAIPARTPTAALYVISYNFPEQFALWLHAVELANPELLSGSACFLVDNSTDPGTRNGYDRLASDHGFTIIREGNLGITGGRVHCARHFDSLHALEGLYWFEDDMLLQPKGAPPCRNGLGSHVANLAEIAPAIVRKEALDFLKLSFTEFFGDHHLNWAWHHLDHALRDKVFPGGSFRTPIRHSGVEGGVSYLVGNVHYDNWPTYMTRRGNAEIFLRQAFEQPSEGTYMARGFELQHRGELRAGVLLASPINHSRSYIYPAAERVES